MLKRLSITRLFGLYNYDIDFISSDSLPLKFLTGPNGYGKSTLLRMIDSLLRRDWTDFTTYDFVSIVFYFDFGTINIQRHVIAHKADMSSDMGGSKDVRLIITYIDNEGEILSSMDILYTAEGVTSTSDGKYPEQMSMELSKISRYFIRDSRFHTLIDIEGRENTASDVTYALRKDFIAKMENAADKVTRILRETTIDLDAPITMPQYVEATQKLKPFADQLMKLDLNAVPWPEYDVRDIHKVTHLVAAYTRMYSQLNDFVERIQLFSDVVRRSKFSHKEMIVQRSLGFFFVVQNEEGTQIDAEQLSSGEQHLIIQTYDILFRAESGSLILIDEPEMSFHLAWQIGYLNYILKLMQSRGVQCIIATHSSQIFQRKWELSCDLYSLHNNKEKA